MEVLNNTQMRLMVLRRRLSRSTLIQNVFSLYIIQFANYILPLITIPYLVRVLGPSGYGAVAFGQGFMNYLLLFVEYGFDLSATRRISVKRDELIEVNRIALHVWAAKGLLALTCLGMLLILVSAVPKLKEEAILLLILYGLVLGNVLFPTWLFQGMERMVAISLINLGMKLIVMLGIFTFVREPQHYLVYASLLSLGATLAGIAGATVAFHMFHLKFGKISIHGVWEILKEGWLLFLSKASVSLYTVGNAFILGMLTNHTVVGYYSAAEKLVKSLLGLVSPVSQATYPRFSKLASENKESAVLWGRRMLVFMGGAGFVISSAIFVGAPFIVQIMLGSQYEPSVNVMRILAGLPFLIALSNVLGIQMMLPLGKDRVFTLILFIAGLLNIILALVFAPLWQASGMALAVLISESFVTASMLITLRHFGITFALRR